MGCVLRPGLGGRIPRLRLTTIGCCCRMNLLYPSLHANILLHTPPFVYPSRDIKTGMTVRASLSLALGRLLATFEARPALAFTLALVFTLVLARLLVLLGVDSRGDIVISLLDGSSARFLDRLLPLGPAPKDQHGFRRV